MSKDIVICLEINNLRVVFVEILLWNNSVPVGYEKQINIFKVLLTGFTRMS